MKKLSVVVVSWNTKKLLSECIASLNRELEGLSAESEVLVIDNNSADGSPEMIRDTFPGVYLIANPDNKGFHHVRVELRNLRYTCEAIAEVLDLSHTQNVQSSLEMLKSLQTTMGEIHDIHKLRTELVAWISSLPARKRTMGMAVASELQKEFDIRMVEFKGHSLASEELLPSLQRQAIPVEVAPSSSN